MSVPTGKVIVKRNRCTMVCGNSGDPVKIICGDPEAAEGSPEQKGSVEVLWETFGGTVNEKGFKTLDKHIGLIYGDSITLERAEEILSRLAAKGFTSDNIVFGIGSYTYNYLTRDTNGFAVKATYVEIDGEGKAIFKAPKTDSGTKKSAKGLLAVVKDFEGTLRLEQVVDSLDAPSELITFFLDGEVYMRSGSMVDVRKRAGSMSY